MFRKSILNSVASFLSIMVNSLFSVVLGRLVIQYLGSDYNGVNATATQILTILTLVEGGLTTASTVALFEPYITKNFQKINDILTTTSKQLQKVAVQTFFIGVIIAIFYCSLIKSNLDTYIIFIVFILSISSTAFNLYYVNTYRLVFQVDQREYYVNFIITISNIIMQVVSMLVISYTQNIILVRLVYFIFNIVTGLIIRYVTKRKYSFIDVNQNYEPQLITGTKDVIISKFTSVIYSSASVLFLSVFVSTISTSIYVTYNNVVSIIKNCIYSVVNAPQNAIGQLWASGDKKKIIDIFNEYEYIVFLLSLCLFSITYIMIIPFVNIYTRSIADVNYIDYLLPILIIGILFLEIIHIPSGIVILMSGDFKISRNIQLITCILLIIFDIVGAQSFELYGLLFGTLFVNLILALLEMLYVRKIKLQMNLSRYYKIYFPLLVIGFFICYIGSKIIWSIKMDVFRFVLYGFITTIMIGVFFLIASLLINPYDTKRFFNRIKAKKSKYNI